MKDRDADLREEIESHLLMATADRVARGEAPDADVLGGMDEVVDLRRCHLDAVGAHQASELD